MKLSVREVAKLLNVSEQKVERWIKKGNLPASRINEQFRINRVELLEWATSRKKAVPAEFFGNGSKESEPASFVEALRNGGIHHRLGGTDKVSALRAVLDAMQLPASCDRESLLCLLLAREGCGSTALGNGIAMPHPRHPIVFDLKKPKVCLCFLANPIDFGASDGKSVHTLFTLVSPTVREHLHLVAQLAFFLRDPGFKGVITRRATKEEILQEAHRVDAELKDSASAA